MLIGACVRLTLIGDEVDEKLDERLLDVKPDEAGIMLGLVEAETLGLVAPSELLAKDIGPGGRLLEELPDEDIG